MGWQVSDILLNDLTSFNIGVLNQNKLLRPLRALSGPSSEGAWAKEGVGLQLLQGGGSGFVHLPVIQDAIHHSRMPVLHLLPVPSVLRGLGCVVIFLRVPFWSRKGLFFHVRCGYDEDPNGRHLPGA